MASAPDLFQSPNWHAPVPEEFGSWPPVARRRNWEDVRRGTMARDAVDRYGPEYPGAASAGEDLGRWLLDTPLLEHRHLAIQVHARRLTWSKAGASQRAVACFEYVRSMPFRCAARPESVSAVQVLRNGHGDGLTKSTLMVSMLRSLGIPSRVRFVSLPLNPLRGFSRTTGACTAHAFTEVFIGNGWIGVDAYIVDVTLGLAARTKLLREGRLCGYGVHMNGATGWDGRTSAFSQFCWTDPAGTPTQDFGAFDDVQEFYAVRDDEPARHMTGHASRAFTTALINRRIEALRGSLRTSPQSLPPQLCISSS